MPIERWSDSLWVAHLGLEPGFSDDLARLHADLADTKQIPDLILSLDSVEKVNSSHLSRMLRLRKIAVDHDAMLRVTSPPDAVWAVFLTTGLDKVFEFDPDVSTALADLQMRRGKQSD